MSLVHSDGPYAVAKAKWDMMKVCDLAAWYRPHIEAWGRLCAPSASIYHWGTAEGWAAVHPEYLRQGWTFRVLINWDKVTPPSMLGWKTVKGWQDQTEVCGFYQRGTPPFNVDGPAVGNVWRVSIKALSLEQIKAKDKVAHRGDEGDVFAALHPCQKPLALIDRIIRASSRPGDLILEPFGGTCRIAVACEQIARYAPADARRYVCVEMNADGVDYIGPVLRQIQENGKQVTLFEGFGR